MRYARWHESLETGDSLVDDQHRALFDLVNDLNASTVLGTGRQSQSEALQRIVQYASIHFEAEQALMERFAYPCLGEHSAVHADFAGTAHGLVAEHAAGKGRTIGELATFMEDWLAKHIASFDQPMVDHIRACRGQITRP